MTDLETNDAAALRPDEFEVLGRVIKVSAFNTLNDGQILGFVKVFRRYALGDSSAELMSKLDHALSKLLDPADNAWLDFQIMEGTVLWTDVLMKIVPCLRPADAEPVKAAKPVKALRAKKAAPAKKATARKTAKRA